MLHLIAQHIKDFSTDIIEVTEGGIFIDAITGEILQAACRKKDVISEKFTDHAYLRYPSEWVSADFAKCVLGKVENGNGLRNYSFLANGTALQLLKREEILPIIEGEKQTPFVLGVTFSNKKHISFKSTPQYNSTSFVIFTDTGTCHCHLPTLRPVLAIMKSWYTVVPERKDTAAQPTFFTKAQIGGEPPKSVQIEAYGVDRFLAENDALAIFRNTLIFKVLLHVLNKTTNND